MYNVILYFIESMEIYRLKNFLIPTLKRKPQKVWSSSS